MILLLKDFECESLVQFHAGGREDGAERACRPSLLTDELSRVTRCNPDLQTNLLIALRRVNRYSAWIVHEQDYDSLQQVGHSFNVFRLAFGHIFLLHTPDDKRDRPGLSASGQGREAPHLCGPKEP